MIIDDETPRDPFVVHCETCEHSWVAAYVPMELTRFARLLSNVHCPMCGLDRIFLGPPKPDHPPKRAKKRQ